MQSWVWCCIGPEILVVLYLTMPGESTISEDMLQEGKIIMVFIEVRSAHHALHRLLSSVSLKAWSQNYGSRVADTLRYW